jgi:predicted porin
MRFAAHGTVALFTGLLLMTASAQAADLGGDCCADLEERVAELEATTVRKGNRRMSLTVSGQVNRSILYWDDGDDSDVYAGLDNVNTSSRFIFSGSARINPNLQAGFEIMTEWNLGARTSSVDQLSPDGSGTGFSAADGGLGVRRAFWWLEDKNLGRISVGRHNAGGPVSIIDLGGIGTVAGHAPADVGGGFLVAGTTRLSGVVNPSYGSDRLEGIRYDSPTIGGFVLQGFWGEDDIWAVSLRYAGEFGGFRVAAGIGYEDQDPSSTQVIQLDNGARNIDDEWAASLAFLHIGTGLFVQGEYAQSEFLNGTDGTFWLVQAGISKNWFGPGNTSIYGEYGNAEDYIKQGPAATGVPGGSTAGLPLASSEVDFYGVGVVQQIDAAAMELYLGWRRFEVDVSGAPVGQNGSSELDLVHGGARVRF